MCTAITSQTLQGNVYFGRTMDFSYPLDPELFQIPKGTSWNNILNTHEIQNKYSVLGIGQDIFPVILADGLNEMGFAAAALYFPGYAQYDHPASHTSSEISIAALELVKFLLCQCADTNQAASLLRRIRIVGVKDSVTDTVAPLHWIMADKKGRCMAVEKMADGLHIIDNPIGVLSNSPDFGWHMTNLQNYMNLAPYQHPEADWGAVTLAPFGQGSGTFGLPGDFAPPSRFARTAFLKSHTPLPPQTENAVNTCFHIMESVSIPKGAVMTSRGTPDYTQYTAFMNLDEKEYYFKTYDNSQIRAVKLLTKPGSPSHIISLGKLADFGQ